MSQDPIKDFYDRWKKPYHAFSTNTVVNEWRREAIESMSISGDDTVVDVGCGTGANVNHLVRQIDDSGHVVCLDISRESLEMLRNTHDNQTVSAVLGDGTRPPIDEPDAYLSTFSIGMFPNPRSAVRRWCQNAHSGTKICIMNVVKSESIFDGALSIFTGLSVPTDIREKLELSINGEALENLTSKVESVHEYLEDNQRVIDKQHRLGGNIVWIQAEVV